MTVLRIVSFGTSLSAHGDWQADLAVQLRQTLKSEIGISIIAQPGANSDWGVANVARVAALQAQIVLIEFAINDASLVRGMSLARSRDNISRIATALRSGEQPRLLLMTMNPAYGLKALIRPLLGLYYDQYRRLAADMQAEFVDLCRAWRELPTVERRRTIPDGLHPTGKAASTIIVPNLAHAIIAGIATNDLRGESGLRAGD